MASPLCENLFQEMARPEFYPHPAAGVDVRETHISKVFLAGEVVYKIKKPLDLGFLDFTSLEKRRRFCMEEVALNRRLAPDVYLGVVAIRSDGGRCRLGSLDRDSGDVVEYAVKMRRLPDHLAMAARLEQGRVGPEEIAALAEVLAEFYEGPVPDSSQAPSPELEGHWAVVAANCRENFAQTEKGAGKWFDARLFAIVRAATIGFLQRRKALFDQRAASGKLRDCHGDLRADHIYFTDAGVRIIDCIEFNQRFRFGDPASDLAFLAMDLDARGHGEIARDFLAAYVRRSGDADLLILMDFYKCYRAMVRFKVDCIRILEPDVGDGERSRLRERISAYLALAYGYAVAFTRPVLWVVCGMPASGKSTIAEALGHSLNIPVLRSDAIRKTLFAPPPVDPSLQAFEGGIYTRGATALTYGRMFLLAQAEIEKGRSVILDATFGSRHFREEAQRLAADMDATIFFVECAAPDPVLKERLRDREGGKGLSDARLIHFDAFREAFEPLDEIRPDQHLVVHTENSVDACLERILYNETIAPGASAPPGAP